MTITLHLSTATDHPSRAGWGPGPSSSNSRAVKSDWCLHSMKSIGFPKYSHQKHYLLAERCQPTVCSCIHLSWPHFPSTHQAIQYFITLVREMRNICYLALRLSFSYAKWDLCEICVVTSLNIIMGLQWSCGYFHIYGVFVCTERK